MSQPTIAFIGGGNMATAMIGGLISSGQPAANIRVADPAAGARNRLAGRGVIACEHHQEAVLGADAVVLAVKPQQLQPVCRALGAQLPEPPPLVLSIAAGVRSVDICRWLDQPVPLVRVMPNTPALVGAGVSALWAGEAVNETQRQLATQIMSAAGTTVWVENEEQLNAVTALSGSGPAYFFLILEALTEAGQTLGLDADTAAQLARQTALGAARMAIESGTDVVTLRQQVTSPGGTTECGIAALEEGDLRGLLQQALTAARDRAAELADEMGRD